MPACAVSPEGSGAHGFLLLQSQVLQRDKDLLELSISFIFFWVSQALPVQHITCTEHPVQFGVALSKA